MLSSIAVDWKAVWLGAASKYDSQQNTKHLCQNWILWFLNFFVVCISNQDCQPNRVEFSFDFLNSHKRDFLEGRDILQDGNAVGKSGLIMGRNRIARIIIWATKIFIHTEIYLLSLNARNPNTASVATEVTAWTCQEITFACLHLEVDAKEHVGLVSSKNVFLIL